MTGIGFSGVLRPVVLMMLAAGVLTACTTGQQAKREGSAGSSSARAGAPKAAGSASPQALPQTRARHARNVIILINDGAGWGTWDATAFWQYGGRAGMPQAGFSQRLGMSTHPLNTANTPTHDAISRVGYDPDSAWDARPAKGRGLPFAGYRYLSRALTDSAAAGTALASGQKTYNNAINIDNFGKPLGFITEHARRSGRATGVVSSVPFSHATPAAFGARNASRKSHHEIADQMLEDGVLDLIIGTGAPGFNVNGTACDSLAKGESRQGCDNAFAYLSRPSWERLAAGMHVPRGHDKPWTVVRTRAEFEALADGRRQVNGPLFGSPEVAGDGTLQYQRQARVLGADASNPSGVAFIGRVPTLKTLTQAALRHLSRDADGFFLMVEGGATDWAAHTSNCHGKWDYGDCLDGRPELGRLIEESADFNDAVASVVDWVNENSSWDETLVVVTSDHDNGIPLGPDADRVAYQPVENRGRGVMPGLSLQPTGDHSNALVPLWAHGAGAQGLAERVRGRDPGFARHVTLIGNDGSYIDNTDVFAVMKAALESPPRARH